MQDRPQIQGRMYVTIGHRPDAVQAIEKMVEREQLFKEFMSQLRKGVDVASKKHSAATTRCSRWVAEVS